METDFWLGVVILPPYEALIFFQSETAQDASIPVVSAVVAKF